MRSEAPDEGRTRLVTAADYPYFTRKLQARVPLIRSSVRDALLRTTSEHHAQLAGQVHDAKDEAFASLLADVDLAEISREVAEMRDIESARSRILMGAYGRCLDCGKSIEWRRLDAYPTAKRCVVCQQRHERSAGLARTPQHQQQPCESHGSGRPGAAE